jgi:hypothetical protein
MILRIYVDAYIREIKGVMEKTTRKLRIFTSSPNSRSLSPTVDYIHPDPVSHKHILHYWD